MNHDSERIIHLEQMSCQSGSRYLLRQIDWQVARGESWVVFGANGSGKTTLLSILAGYRSHTEGTVEVLGQPFDSSHVLAMRRRIGWVSGSFFDSRYSREAVLDIVLSGVTGTLCPCGLVTDRHVVRAKTLLADFGIAGKVYEPFDTLSKGEREKVLLSRALVGEPELLLLDEPGTGLDLAARERLIAMIDDMARDPQLTVIYVTHHVEELPPAFDRCLLLKGGHVLGQCSVDEAFSPSRLSGFLQYPLDLHTYHGRRFAQGLAEREGRERLW